MQNNDNINNRDEIKEKLRKEMDDALKAGAGPKIARFALACLSGVPYVGGAIGGATAAWSEAEQTHFNKIFATWLKLQEDEIREIGITLMEVMLRLDKNDPKVEERIQSPEYLSLIRKCFRDWSATESEDKRRLIRNLLSNAGATRLCSDDVLRLFIDWIGQYSEAHFRVIQVIYKEPGCTRAEIWQHLHGHDVREDSADADLFKLLIRDLSTGSVIRQHRETDGLGRFLKEPARRAKSSTIKSAFDDEKPYELTELGKQFVHYTMNEIVPRLSAASSPQQQ